MSVKQINVKQAERLLQKLKNQNPQSYKNLVKSLRTYEKNDDEYDCYVKINHTLLPHLQLTKEINSYMEEANKFVVNRPEGDKIKELLFNIKRLRPDLFGRIIQLINDLSKNKGETEDINKILKPKIKEIVMGDAEVQRMAEMALDLSAEEIIERRNLEHLKLPKTAGVANEEEKEIFKQPQLKQPPQKEKRSSFQPVSDFGRQLGSRFNRPTQIGPFTNPSEEKSIFRQIQKMASQNLYNYIAKIVKIYHLNIITRSEAFDLLAEIQIDQFYMECLKQILDTRETDRRKSSCFKPLEDLNFSDVERASPSYVAMPQYYPIQSSGKTEWIKAITNQRWVSVPQGSQESENFSVRNKNSNEINLLKAEDQRYQFDIYMHRLQKTLQFFDQLLDEKTTKTVVEKHKIVKNIIYLGTLQLIYRQSNRDQRQEMQWYLKITEVEICKIFRERVNSQINQLKNIKEIHANKNWNEIASKNFFKALDLKGFEFKKNQKEKMKATFFTSELQERLKLLQSGGQQKKNLTFEEKKDFFTILNSFECSSRTQKCNNRSLPQIQAFDMKDEKNRRLYPLIILSFEDLATCQNLYSLLLFYISSFQMGQLQKYKCKVFLERFFINFLGWKLPPRQYLNENFDQQKFYSKINGSQEQINSKQWISEENQQALLLEEEKVEDFNKAKDLIEKFGCLNDQVSSYSYLPAKNQEKSVLYGTENLYTLSRFVYAAYQRLIKMKEVAESPEKIELFKILFYACIKTKEGSKFQQNLNLLFGKHAYLFSTLYKLFDNLIKSLSNITNCPLMLYSLQTYSYQHEDVYFLNFNKFCLNTSLNNNKIIRLTYNKQSKAVYFNYLESYYKSDETSKDTMKKRLDIAKSIQMYTTDNFDLGDKKRRRPNQAYQNSEIQYNFQGSTIKMSNHRQNEDLLLYVGKKALNSKITFKRDLKRANKFRLI